MVISVPRIDVHQHLWPEAFLAALARRTAAALRADAAAAGPRPPRRARAAVDPAAHDPDAARPGAEADGVERALGRAVAPAGHRGAAARGEARPLLDAWHDGVLELGAPFGAWGASRSTAPTRRTSTRCSTAARVGASRCPPARSPPRPRLERRGPLLDALAARGAPLFVHPGPAPAPAGARARRGGPRSPRYVADMHAAWLAWAAWGRPAHPRLRVLFAMLAGGAPLHAERLAARGGPADAVHDPLTFYDTSSYGPTAVDAMAARRRVDQLVLRLRPPGRRAAAARRPRPDGAPRRWHDANPARLLAGARDARHDRCRPTSATSTRRRARGARRPPRRPTRRPGGTSSATTPTRAPTSSCGATTHVAVWLICWMEDHDTGFHDHDLSARRASPSCAGACARSGSLLGGEPARRTLAAGASFGLRRLRHPPRLARRRRARGDAARLLAAAVAHGRLRGRARRRAARATRSPTRRSCGRSTRTLRRWRLKDETPGLGRAFRWRGGVESPGVQPRPT